MTAINDEATSFAKREPAVLTGLVVGPVAGVVAGLVKSGVVTSGQAPLLVSVVTGAVVAVVLVAQGFVLRTFVSSKWKQFTGSAMPEALLDPSLDAVTVDADTPAASDVEVDTRPRPAPLVTGTRAPVQVDEPSVEKAATKKASAKKQPAKKAAKNTAR